MEIGTNAKYQDLCTIWQLGGLRFSEWLQARDIGKKTAAAFPTGKMNAARERI